MRKLSPACTFPVSAMRGPSRPAMHNFSEFSRMGYPPQGYNPPGAAPSQEDTSPTRARASPEAIGGWMTLFVLGAAWLAGIAVSDSLLLIAWQWSALAALAASAAVFPRL